MSDNLVKFLQDVGKDEDKKKAFQRVARIIKDAGLTKKEEEAVLSRDASKIKAALSHADDAKAPGHILLISLEWFH